MRPSVTRQIIRATSMTRVRSPTLTCCAGQGLFSHVSVQRNGREQRKALAYFLTQLTQATQRPERKDGSGAYSCVAFVALRMLRALRWVETCKLSCMFNNCLCRGVE